ncbi:MAG: hypothetical protein AAGF71_04910 [Pseudomonadota bacterium]
MHAFASDTTTSTAPADRVSDLTAEQQTWLKNIRRLAGRARVEPQLDMHRACLQIGAKPCDTDGVCVQSLLRTLSQAIGRRAIFHATDAQQISFDEAWLLRLWERMAADDTDSVGFLLSSRVALPYRRPLIFLLKGTAAAALAA